MTDSRPMLIDLDGHAGVDCVGNKAFNLMQIRHRRRPTPDGAVIPDCVLQRHLERAKVTADIDDLFRRLDELHESEIAASAASLRERIAATDIEPALADELAALWRDRWRQQPLVVRSSAVGEDGTEASFAGQLDSFLNVDGIAGLEAAVKATWCSLFSRRVLLYTRHRQLRVGHMGVIVQPQVRAQVSGVLFTRDPAARHGETMLIEFCIGLGDKVAGGLVTPGRLRVDRGDLALTLEHAGDDPRPLEDDARTAISEIAGMGLALEAEYGFPLDIEWCVDHASRPVIVQVRPATGAARTAYTTRVHWTNANIAENFPEPVSPFLFSIVKPGYSAYFRNLGRGFGMSRDRLAAMTEPLDNIVGLQGGRLYYNLTNIHTLLQMMPWGQRLVEYFNLFVGAAAIPAPPRITLSPHARAIESLRIAGSIFWQYLFVQRRMRRFEARVDRFAAGTEPRKLASKSARALVADLHGLLTIRFTQWNDAALADTAAMVCYGLLKAFLARHHPDGITTALHNDLLKGLPDLASAEPVARLWDLSRQVGRQPDLAALIEDASAEEVLTTLRADRFGEFRDSFTDYLDNWGFRSSGELMLTNPTPQEDPLPVLRLLQTYVRTHTVSPTELTLAQAREREAATARVAAQLSLGWWRYVPLLSRASRFRILLSATQGAIRLRERARMKQALLYTRLRHIALQLGERLAASGVLAHRDDVFLLTVSEVEELVADGSAGTAELVDSRRKAQEAFQSWQPPDRLVLDEGEVYEPRLADQPGRSGETPPGRLKGSGACGGSATGAAAVVLDVAEADRVQEGQILVTRQTDPGWATVFFLVRGLVIERGGMLSHGAIIAREYGIPAVVGVPDATRLIRDGDGVRVDGDLGLVEVTGG